MKTVAEFKRRMKVGSLWYGTYQVKDQYGQVGMIKNFGLRRCGKSNSVGFAFETQAGDLSHCDWPKKREYYCNGETVVIKSDLCLLTYTQV